jgi:tricorn protease-like protein
MFARIDRGHRTLLSYLFPTGAGRPNPRLLRRVRYGLHTVSVDGGVSRRIGTLRGGLIDAVASSPDGGQVVFAHVDPRGTTSLRGVSPDGTITTIRTVRRAVGGLDFSPSGDRLAIALLSRESAGIYVMAPSGGSLRRITTPPSFDFAPVWSPDGTAISFMRVVGSGRHSSDAVYTVAADGGRPRRLRDFGDVDVLPVAWQPLARPPVH